MSGSISVPNYASGNLVPGIYINLDPANANTASAAQRTLIIGQKIATGGGSYPPNVPIQTLGVNDINTGCGGPNAMLARMVARYRKSDPLGTVWVAPLLDDPSATKTTVTVTITGTASAAGTLAAMVAGSEVLVPVNSGDTNTVIAGNLSAMVNQITSLPATASLASNVVTLTADNAGQSAGDLDVRLNYYGNAGNEQTPPGVNVVIATASAGMTNPLTGLTAALANLGSKPFDFIVCPYTDTASLNLMDALLSAVTGRWSLQQQVYGQVFTAIRGSVGARGTFAASRNDPFISCMGFYDSPTPAYEWAADYCGACALSLRANPALPLGAAGAGVPLTVLAPPVQNQDIYSNQQTLLVDGVATYAVTQVNTLRVQRAVNIYTMNPAGQPDNSYQQVESNLTLMAVLRDFATALSTQFGRKVLVADGTPLGGGSNQVTSQTVLAAAISRYRLQCTKGLCQNAALFASTARASNNGGGVVALYLPIQIANQLFEIVCDAAFSKP